ncbi:hypothetical protein [Amycolatopsis thermoflava]|uniref:Uncharacterized protein n=1 Tax=Amycolatopsis thermoflava TaxID=84480 RepID=A0A3N2G646_9PSEU|nr:hypothetical protein [Amycolatopsis thermoflava]ROS32122.1 hypothetical protein EDD35_7869 [Amycolatopsis thermoflava]
MAAAVPLGTTWEDLEDAAKKTVWDGYHRYLMAREHTRRFLDTNNLIVDLDVGKASALEEFKRVHRALDVLKELQEQIRRRLENIRRADRLAAADTSDPDVDSVVVIGDGDSSAVGPVVIGTRPTPTPMAPPP